MTKSEQGSSNGRGEVQTRETRLCNICLYLKDFAEFNGADIGCKRCRNARAKEVRHTRANDLLVTKERGKYINGRQAELLTALIKGYITKLDIAAIVDFSGVDRQRATRWMRKRKFIDALICVTKRYDVVIEVHDPPEIRRERGKKPVPSYEVLVDDTRKQFMALGTPITEALRKECPANIADLTPEARLNAVIKTCLFLGCEVRFVKAAVSGESMYCTVTRGLEPGEVLFSILCETVTEAINGVAEAISNKHSGIVPEDMFKIMRGEIEIG